MFQTTRPKTTIGSAVRTFELIFHTAARDIRKGHGNALVALLMNIAQASLLLLGFYAMGVVLGGGTRGIRGDYMLFTMSGVFLYLTHTKAIGAVVGAEGASGPLMKHAPMNPAIMIAASALSALYIQVLTIMVMLLIYHAAVTPVVIDRPIGAMAMLLLAWGSGIGIGLVFAGFKPWAPQWVTLLSSIYSRVNMVASGKMFVANMMPSLMLSMVDWNPLFHAIDQARGFIFINYTPYFSTLDYPVAVTLALWVVGMMLEFRIRRNLSISRMAAR